MRGFWSNVCSRGGFPPEAARVACKDLDFDGVARLLLGVPYTSSLSTTGKVRMHCMSSAALGQGPI